MSLTQEYPPVNAAAAQMTVRSIATGMVLGAGLSLCNIYSGLKIGWGFNMSITAALLGFAVWKIVPSKKPFGMIENNLNQTAASAGASISSAGLVAPIPALTMITGQTFGWFELSIWVLSVALVGVVVAIGLRKQMLVTENLAFPNGIATAETLKEMYAEGKEAMARVRMLLIGGALGGGLKLLTIIAGIKKWYLPGAFEAGSGGWLASKGYSSLSLKNLGFALDPSLMMVGVGALIGFRACASMMLGAAVCWLVVAPIALDAGWMIDIDPAKHTADNMWWGAMNKWMLWPGVAMMVTCSLTSFAFSWRAVLGSFTKKKNGAEVVEDPDAKWDVPRNIFLWSLLGVLTASVVLQYFMFGIGIGLAAFGVLLTFALAIVAGRVSGETGVTPVGAMGKVTQLTLGVIAPGAPATNLMAANVTGGAASQCADMLHDLKTGLLIGSAPKYQIIAQAFGVIAGAFAGSAAYLVLIPDPANMLLTEEWAAPAVAAWKAVAEIFADGLDSMPPMALDALFWGGLIGVILAVMEKTLPKSWVRFVPSPAAAGLALVIPAYYPILFFIGGLALVIGERFFKSWTARFMIVLAAGVIAGESLVGVGNAIKMILVGG